MPASGAPKLSETFTEAIKLGFESKGLWTLVPWLLVPTFAVCILVANIWRCEIFAILARPGFLNVLGAMMVIGGLLSTVCINIMRETYAITGEKDFAAFLRKLNLFDQYLFWPQYVLLLQLSLVVYCLVVISAIVVFPTQTFVPYLVSCAFGFLFYVAVKTYGLVDMVRVLVWHRQDFREQWEAAEREAALRRQQGEG